jgi:polyphosphate glucokinase
MANLIAEIAARAALSRQNGARPQVPAVTPHGAADAKLTLAIDIGGTKLKAGVLTPVGELAGGPARISTPHPSAPSDVVAALLTLVEKLGAFDRISVGFPGVVRKGHVLTAPNLGTQAWAGFDLAGTLTRHLGKPVRLLNDASVQGLGVIAGEGLECVLTFGTGMGYALFADGQLAPHLEMGQHMCRKGLSYDHYIGNAALQEVGEKRWNRRAQKVIAAIDTLVNYDTLLIGGGNAKKLAFELPPRVRLVPNEAGITGGVRLWDAKLDTAFG